MSVSAYQINLWLGEGGCHRKGAFVRDKHPLSWIDTPASKLGKDLHDIMEAYHKKGTAPDASTPAGRIALAGLRWNPPPLTYEAEGAFRTKFLDITFIGRIDLMSYGAVIDHKTSGNMKLAMKSLDPPNDVQGLIYAAHCMQKYDDCNGVAVRWIYYQTKGEPKSGCRDHWYDRKAFLDTFHRVCYEPAMEVERLRRLPLAPLEYAPNYRSCDNFGGCQFKHECGVP